MNEFNIKFQNASLVDSVDTRNLHNDVKTIGENLLEDKSIFEKKASSEETNSDSIELSKKQDEK